MSRKESIKLKQLRIPEPNWALIAHEAIDQNTSIQRITCVAVDHFLTLPVAERKALVCGAGAVAA
jgi:hypothetical protein